MIISGSNAELLSGDLATRISGRYLNLTVYPLSLSEYSHLYFLLHAPITDTSQLFKMYLHTDLNVDVYTQMQRDIFHTIAVKDIIGRHAIRDIHLFESIIAFAMDNIGSIISAKRITDFLKKERRSLSVDSVLNYLEFMKEGFLVYEVPRYDVRGNRRKILLQRGTMSGPTSRLHIFSNHRQHSNGNWPRYAASTTHGRKFFSA